MSQAYGYISERTHVYVRTLEGKKALEHFPLSLFCVWQWSWLLFWLKCLALWLPGSTPTPVLEIQPSMPSFLKHMLGSSAYIFMLGEQELFSTESPAF